MFSEESRLLSVWAIKVLKHIILKLTLIRFKISRVKLKRRRLFSIEILAFITASSNNMYPVNVKTFSKYSGTVPRLKKPIKMAQFHLIQSQTTGLQSNKLSSISQNTIK